MMKMMITILVGLAGLLGCVWKLTRSPGSGNSRIRIEIPNFQRDKSDCHFKWISKHYKTLKNEKIKVLSILNYYNDTLQDSNLHDTIV
eukprot:scaffold3258_cov169-Ochromonas_danica.AAC.2